MPPRLFAWGDAMKMPRRDARKTTTTQKPMTKAQLKKREVLAQEKRERDAKRRGRYNTRVMRAED